MLTEAELKQETAMAVIVGGAASAALERLMNAEDAHPDHKNIIQCFQFTHLPERLQAVAIAFASTATVLMGRSSTQDTPGNAELTVAFRKLLEARDAAVRAAL